MLVSMLAAIVHKRSIVQVERKAERGIRSKWSRQRRTRAIVCASNTVNVCGERGRRLRRLDVEPYRGRKLELNVYM